MPFLDLGASGFCIEKCSLHRQRREGRENNNKFQSTAIQNTHSMRKTYRSNNSFIFQTDTHPHSAENCSVPYTTDLHLTVRPWVPQPAIDGKPLDTLPSISKMEKYSVPPCSTTDTLHKNRRGCPVSDHVTVIVQRVLYL